LSVTVTLQVFSGRQNPSWSLDDTQASELRDRLAEIRTTSYEKPPGIIGGLGYTGFLIEAKQEADIEPSIFVHDDVVDLGSGNVSLRGSGRALESWLLRTGGDAVEPVVKQHVEDKLRPAAYAGRSSAAVRARALEVPRFEPHVWNTNPTTLYSNNCYNYGCNLMTNSFAQPGRASGYTPAAMAGAEYARACASDGLEVLASQNMPASTPAEGHFMALVIWPGADFHFYRLDDMDAKWSHKPGHTQARDFDGSNAPIADPKTCDRGPYTEFVGYLYVIPPRITIR
jgi:hypothetical protein